MKNNSTQPILVVGLILLAGGGLFGFRSLLNLRPTEAGALAQEQRIHFLIDLTVDFPEELAQKLEKEVTLLFQRAETSIEARKKAISYSFISGDGENPMLDLGKIPEFPGPANRLLIDSRNKTLISLKERVLTPINDPTRHHKASRLLDAIRRALLDLSQGDQLIIYSDFLVVDHVNNFEKGKFSEPVNIPHPGVLIERRVLSKGGTFGFRKEAEEWWAAVLE